MFVERQQEALHQTHLNLEKQRIENRNRKFCQQHVQLVAGICPEVYFFFLPDEGCGWVRWEVGVVGGECVFEI